MINIKVIEIRKCYKWISIFITLVLCVFSFRLLILDTSEMVVKAYGTGKGQNFVQAEEQNNTYENLLIFILNKTIPVMEVNYKENNRSHDYKEIIKIALGKVIGFNYEDPKTLFKAQISVLNEVDDDLAEQGEYLGFNDDAPKNNSEETHYIEDLSSIPNNTETQNSDGVLDEEVPTVSDNNVEATEPKEEVIPVVTSPIRMPNKVKLDDKSPTIFIYHTHGTESYLPEEIGNFHSLNEKFTVRAVGEQLKEQLAGKGYNVIHENMLHDYPSYQQSYVRALETLSENLKKKPSLKIIFDIHRDAASDNEESREKSYVMINNEKVAKFSIVVGTKNENVEQLKLFAEYIRAKSDERYPGLAKKTIFKEYKFNQYNSDYYALLEVGNTANDINEALRTAKYLAQIMDSVIKDISE